jgi:hypothetical protein
MTLSPTTLLSGRYKNESENYFIFFKLPLCPNQIIKGTLADSKFF